LSEQKPKEMTIEWKKNFQLEARRRGLSVLVDQPKDDGGDDTGFNPVELLVASLGACIGYYALLFLGRRKIDPKGLKISMAWEYGENPRRVAKLKAEISLDAKLDDHQVSGLLKITSGCTVHNTLTHAPDISINIA